MAQKIKDAYPNVDVRIVLLDLMSQQAVRKAAREVPQLTSKLDIIINNAAVMTPKLQHTAEGLEAQFGSSHIGHFLFTTLLLPLLIAAAKSNAPGATRVVNLTSLGHRLSPVRFHDYNFEGNPIPDEEKSPADLPAIFEGRNGSPYNGFIAYGQAKSANILFSVGLNEKLKEQGIVSYAVHPGCMLTP